MQFIWKDIVNVNGMISAEAYPISGKMTDDDHYEIDDFLTSVAKKYDVAVDDVKTYMMDNIEFDPKTLPLPFGAEDCGCYVNGIAEWLVPCFAVTHIGKMETCS